MGILGIIIPLLNLGFLVFLVYFMILATKALKIYIRNNKDK